MRSTLGLGTTSTVQFGPATVSSATIQGLTATRIPYVSTGGLLKSDAAMTFDVTGKQTTLTANAGSGTSRAALRLTGGTANGQCRLLHFVQQAGEASALVMAFRTSAEADSSYWIYNWTSPSLQIGPTWLVLSATQTTVAPSVEFRITDGNLSVGGSPAYGGGDNGVLGFTNTSTSPTTAHANSVLLWATDYAAGDSRLYVWSETGDHIAIGNDSLTLHVNAANEGKLTTATLTGDRVYTLPDATGAIALAGDALSVVDGRLTLTTATPVTVADVTGAGTIYYTPMRGNRIALYTGAAWAVYTTAEISKALTLTSGKNYDVYAYASGSTVVLELSAAWTDDTTRADALAWQDGVLVKSGATTRRYLGTIRASGANTTEDSVANRFVSNYYNRVPRPMFSCPAYNDDNAQTSYTTASTSFTPANGGTGSKLAFLSQGQDAVEYGAVAAVTNDGANSVSVGVGEDSTTTTQTRGFFFKDSSAYGHITASRTIIPASGYHYLELLVQTGGGTATYFADLARVGSAVDPRATYISATVMA